MTKKKKKPQDATRRNTQAANKRLQALDQRIDHLQLRVALIEGVLRDVQTEPAQVADTPEPDPVPEPA